MSVRLRSPQDFWSAMLFAVIAVIFLWDSSGLIMGTARQMGPAYMPRMLCGLMLVAAGILFVRSFRVDGERSAGFSLRPILVVPAAMIVFALALAPLGILITVWLTIGIASLADKEMRPLEAVLAAVFLSLFAVGVFVEALQLNIPIWPEF